MPTLAELMASLGAVQAAGMGQTGALLTQTAEQERRDIEQAYIDLERQQREKEEAARRRRSEDTRLNSSHITISYAVFCLKKKTKITIKNNSNK